MENYNVKCKQNPSSSKGRLTKITITQVLIHLYFLSGLNSEKRVPLECIYDENVSVCEYRDT
jgi:hypothetical protein